MHEKCYEIFDFIVHYKKREDGNSPTIRDIRDGLNISSTSVVTYHLGVLEKRGLLRRDGHNISVVGGWWIVNPFVLLKLRVKRGFCQYYQSSMLVANTRSLLDVIRAKMESIL